MADIPEPSNRNAGSPLNPSAPPNIPDLAGIMTNLAQGQTVMQETMRQLIQTLHGGAPTHSGLQSIQRNTHLPSSRTRRTNSYCNEESEDFSYQPGRTSPVRATDTEQRITLSPERTSALEKLSRVSPFDRLGPRRSRSPPKVASRSFR